MGIPRWLSCPPNFFVSCYFKKLISVEHFYFTFKEQLLSCCEEPLSVSYTDVVSDLLSWVSKGPCPLSAYVNEEVKFNFESLQGELRSIYCPCTP